MTQFKYRDAQHKQSIIIKQNVNKISRGNNLNTINSKPYKLTINNEILLQIVNEDSFIIFNHQNVFTLQIMKMLKILVFWNEGEVLKKTLKERFFFAAEDYKFSRNICCTLFEVIL